MWIQQLNRVFLLFFQIFWWWVPPLLNCRPRHVPSLPIWEIRPCLSQAWTFSTLLGKYATCYYSHSTWGGGRERKVEYFFFSGNVMVRWYLGLPLNDNIRTSMWTASFRCGPAAFLTSWSMWPAACFSLPWTLVGTMMKVLHKPNWWQSTPEFLNCN